MSTLDSTPPASALLREFDFPSLAGIGLEAVCALWRAKPQSFARSSIDDQLKLRPTVTFRCVEVLLATMAEQPDLMRDHAKVVDAAAARIVGLDASEVEQASDLAYMPFTAALWTLAAARAAVGGTASAKPARERLPELVAVLRSQLPESALADVHPFVQEHALRAALACQVALEDESLDGYILALRRSIEAATERLLARHYAGLITPAESVVLVFCASALSTAGGPREERLALAALSAAASAQDLSGSWPLGRVVRNEPSRLEISTHEVAWAMTDTLGRLLDGLLSRIDHTAQPAAVGGVLDAIARASIFSLRSVVELEESRRGWASDHPYQQSRIESWTSAIVLQFALAGERLRDRVRNREVLGSFSAIHPTDPSWPTWLRWEKLEASGEPDAKYSIYDYLRRMVIEPIETHPQHLPSGTKETASVLLFGPPGTSKTTIVKAVADRLGWPIVFLSPGSFIEQGMEAIEATAKSVFARLLELRQVVIIFDECDELFRDRNPAGATEQVRNISAFVTASMLPKLQDLHDRGKVLFFICTNHAEMMDQAVLRGGRMDHRIGVGPPDEAARQAIIASFRGELPEKKYIDAALEHLGLSAERFSRGELRRAARKLATSKPWRNRDAAVKSAHTIVHDMEEALMISDKAMIAFVEQQRKLSDPYLEKAS